MLSGSTFYLVYLVSHSTILITTMHNGFTIATARFLPTSIIIYNQKYGFPARTIAQKENEVNLTRGNYNGFMSPKTKSKVSNYLATWIQSIKELKADTRNLKVKKKPYLTFVTLTLPSKQVHDDNKIKRIILSPFIQTIQRKFNVWNYYWRAEAQKNGNIHFHIIIDSYIDHKELRTEWNRAINKLNYVDVFEQSHGHNNPNSSDIHSLKNINNAAAYLIKYVSKTDGYRGIEGRIHGCSERIRLLKPYDVEIDSSVHNYIKAIKSLPTTAVYEGDNFQIVNFLPGSIPSSIYYPMQKKFKAYFLDIALDLYNHQFPSWEEMASIADDDAQTDNVQGIYQTELYFFDQATGSFFQDKYF